MAQEKLVKRWEKVSEDNYPTLIEELKKKLTIPAAIILSGPVGAGKTTFTKYFVSKENKAEILSPTYSLINEAGDVAHADFYRLKTAEEVVHLELNLYLEGKNFFLIEWGKPFLKDISRNLTDDFFLYELVFEIEEKENLDGPRNVCLYELNLT